MAQQEPEKRKYTKGRGRGVIEFERLGGNIPTQSSVSDEELQAICQGVVFRIWNDCTEGIEPGGVPKMTVAEALVNEEPWGVSLDQLAATLRALLRAHGKPRCIIFPKKPDGDVTGRMMDSSVCKGCIFASTTYGKYWECGLDDVQPLDIMDELRKNMPIPAKRGQANQPRLRRRKA